MLFRYQDGENYYKLELDQQTGLIHLTPNPEGCETILARAYGGYTPREPVKIRVEVKGERIGAWLDDAEIFGSEVADPTLESGTVALYSWGSEGVAFEHALVTHLGAPEDGLGDFDLIETPEAGTRGALRYAPGEADAAVDLAGILEDDEQLNESPVP